MINPRALAEQLADGYVSEDAAAHITDYIANDAAKEARIDEENDRIRRYARTNSGDVTYLCYEPQNGYVYEVVVSALPADVLGGEVTTHALVTLFTPDGTWAYVLPKDDDLHASYLFEKLRYWIADAHHRPSAEAIWLALGRGLIL